MTHSTTAVPSTDMGTTGQVERIYTETQPRHQFTPEELQRGGIVGGERLRSKWMERHRRNAELTELVADMEREDVGLAMLVTILRTSEALLANPVPVPQDGTDYKRLVESIALAHKVLRLEAGESTSNSATLDVTERDARLTALRARLAELGDTEKVDPVT